MTNQSIAIPTVHLNGTSGAVLLEQLKGARRALDAALDALAEAAPNARDYYVQPGGFSPAQRQHEARLAKLREVRSDVSDVLQGVLEQVNARVRP